MRASRWRLGRVMVEIDENCAGRSGSPPPVRFLDIVSREAPQSLRQPRQPAGSLPRQPQENSIRHERIILPHFLITRTLCVSTVIWASLALDTVFANLFAGIELKMSSCHHGTLELLPERKTTLRCRYCHLTIAGEELGDGFCPECFETSGRKLYEFEQVAATEGSSARYRCEECGAIIKSP